MESVTSLVEGEINADDWKTRIEKLEKEVERERSEKKGIYRDLKEAERRAKDLEARITSAPPPQNGNDDPSLFINDVNTRGKAAVLDVIKPILNPILEQTRLENQRRDKERALRWLAKQESRRHNKVLDEDDVEDSMLPKVIEVAKEHGLLQSMDWENGTKAAYKILLSDEQKARDAKEEEERVREERIRSTSTDQAGSFTAPTTKPGRFLSRAEVNVRLQQIDASRPSEDDKKFLAMVRQAADEGRIK